MPQIDKDAMNQQRGVLRRRCRAHVAHVPEDQDWAREMEKKIKNARVLSRLDELAVEITKVTGLQGDDEPVPANKVVPSKPRVPKLPPQPTMPSHEWFARDMAETAVCSTQDIAGAPSYTVKRRPRRSFARHRAQMAIPSLMQLQRKSYAGFLQATTPPQERDNFGLQAAFHSVFPIESSSGAVVLHFKEYELRPPFYTLSECKLRGLTYHSQVYAKIEMAIHERKGGAVKAVKEETVYMGDMPLMTPNGSFVINGTERVVVSQLHRSPGVLFEHDSGRNTSGGKYIYSARIIPYSGSWIDFEFDKRDILYFRIDRKRKMPVTILLKALGYDKKRILREFYENESFRLGKSAGESEYRLRAKFLHNMALSFDLCDFSRREKTMTGETGGTTLVGRRPTKDIVTDDGEVLVKERMPIDADSLDAIREAGIKEITTYKVIVPKSHRIKRIDLKKMEMFEGDYHPTGDEFLYGRRLSADVFSAEGEEIARANAEITQEVLDNMRAAGIQEIETLYVNEFDHGPFIAQTLSLDEKLDGEKSRETIYRMLRPGDPPNREVVNHHLDAILYDSAIYNMSRVGRMKFNRRLYDGRPTMEYKVLMSDESARMNKGETANAVEKMVAAGCFQDEESAAEYLAYVKQFGARRAIIENLDEAKANEIAAALKDVVRIRVEKQTTLSRTDILTVVKYLVDLRNGKQKADDIDNLSNRRVRAVGEFIENQFSQGLQRVNRAIRDRLSRAEVDELMPHNLISAKAVSSSVMEFFNGNQLSQFMDQTNPLAEVTHKRRVSAFGVGGLNRDRVGFEVRDVHPSHYGRICPIETPEGPNIGLINSMSLYAEVDEYGFLRTPYVPVKKGTVTDEVKKLAAIDEQGKVIAQAGSPRNKRGKLTDALVTARRDGEYVLCPPEDVDYVDIAPSQIASVAASLIPFLEHDDANRALMGSNMQRQGVPCLYPEKPLVGTGVERMLVHDSGALIQARRGGTVSYVDANRVAVRVADKEITAGARGVDIYPLPHPTRSNQNTNIGYRPIVREGDVIVAGDVIADGAATDLGEIALGQNLLVAFLPWNGYNYEDSILISEKVVADQRYASIHIIEEIAHARSTPLGDEEITRDIPHQSDASLMHLDDEGIVNVGVHVKPGDILVGKISPKGDRQLTPEEKLLHAVFGDKAKDVKDASMRMPPGSSGVVIDVKVLESEEAKRRGIKISSDSERMRSILEAELEEYKRGQEEAWRIMEEDAHARIRKLVTGKTSAKKIGEISKGERITAEGLASLKKKEWSQLDVGIAKTNQQIQEIVKSLDKERTRQEDELAMQEEKISGPYNLQQGILKTVKVYVAIKRNLQVGDKMAGRHGNKGVVSKIVPAESMPYMEDGTPVDVVLSPLGVPSRMNVGQILETHLGLAAKGIGAKVEALLREEQKKQISGLRAFLAKVFADDGNEFDPSTLTDEELLEAAHNLKKGLPYATPIFDGASEEDIRRMLELGDLPTSGQMTLYDGYSGEPFERPVTVGCMYILKLHHLVDEKMHARSTGPYSLITQQPLGGKAQRGGQRFGEMEVWALEAYGAAYTLCEMLTVKSDDIYWRTKMFESISEGDLKLKTGTPESFNVLVQEVRALGIDMKFLSDD